MTRHARGSSSRQGANMGQYFIAEISKLRGLCVLRLRERELRHQDVGRIVARTGAHRNDEALHDPAAVVGPMRVTPRELVLDAIRQGGRVIVSTYNEPLIT